MAFLCHFNCNIWSRNTNFRMKRNWSPFLSDSSWTWESLFSDILYFSSMISVIWSLDICFFPAYLVNFSRYKRGPYIRNWVYNRKFSRNRFYYRVSHHVSDLGWVDFGYSTASPILLGLMGNWQNWLSSWARRVEHPLHPIWSVRDIRFFFV